jgi:hypothetical protein
MTRPEVERHGTGLTWFDKNGIWLAPVVGFFIAIGLAYAVVRWL